MLIAYGNYGMTFALSSSPAGATFLTDQSNLADGRSGTVTGIQWPAGAMTTASYVQLTVTVSSPLDVVAALGVMGIVNVVGLPEGTRVFIGQNAPTWIEQRLVKGFRDELSAWVIPTAAQNSNTFIIRIMNDVNGSASIAAQTPFAIGEVFAGRLTSIPTLRRSSPGSGMIDPTAWDATNGVQFYSLMRKPARTETATLGMLSRRDVYAGGTVMSGGNPSASIPVNRLKSLLATMPICAVCDYTHDGVGATLLSAGGYPFQKDFIQQTMMLARPSQLGDILETDSPYFTWPVRFSEAM